MFSEGYVLLVVVYFYIGSDDYGVGVIRMRWLIMRGFIIVDFGCYCVWDNLFVVEVFLFFVYWDYN